MSVVQNEKLADYEENLELFANQTLDFAIYMLDPIGRIRSWNAGAERLYGYSAQEIIDSDFSVCYTPEDVAAEKPRRALEMAARDGSYRQEGLRVRKDHTSFWAAATITALKDQAGNLRGFAKLTHDITRYKTNETKYLALFEHSHDGVLLTRPADGAVLKANSAACNLFGYAEQELLAKRRDDLLDPADPGFAQAWAERAVTGAAAAELTFIRKGGEQFKGRVASKLFMDESGQQMSCTTIQDITEQKRVEEVLRESEEKYRTLFDNMTEGFVLGEPILDSAGHAVDFRYLAVNEAYYAQTGTPSINIAGRRVRECFPQIEQFWIDRYATVARTGQPDRFDAYNADTRRHYDLYAFSPSPGRFAVLFRDITEQKRAEEALKTFKFFSDHSSESNLVVDAEGRIRYVNRRLCERTGYSEEELLRFHIQDINPNATEALLGKVVERSKDGGIPPFESIRRRKDGSTYPVEISATVLEVQGEWLTFSVARDITERKRAEQALKDSERRLTLALEASASSVYDTDVAAGMVRGEERYFTMLGYAAGELTSLSDWWDAVHPDDREVASKRFDEVIQGKHDFYRVEVRVRAKDGSWRWILSQSTVAERDAEGRAVRMIGTHTDITERKEVEEALRQSEEKFRATFEHAPLGIAECSVDGRFIQANSKLAEILGYTKDEIAHLTMKDVTHPGDAELSLVNLQKLAAGEANSYVIEKRYIRKDHSMVWVNVTASFSPIPGKPHYLVVTVEDITARKKAEEDLKRAMESSYHQATHDMLTGLANRAAFPDRLAEALAYAKRDGHLVALHLIDLDRFKSINDTLGHHIGDLLLKEVAKRIKSQVRATDLAARLGGDEFVVIQTHLAEPAAAGILAGKLVEELGRPYVLEDQQGQCGASIGVAVFPGDAENPEDLIKRADLALYEAKHRGRSNYQFYRQELGVAFVEAQRLEQELVRALRENEFCLHYLPQFDLKNGRMTGIEALLRWRHPNRGLLAAREFLPDAEHAKLMLPLGEWVLQTACFQHKEWVDSGLAVPLTLNLSSTQLRDPRLLETLKRILEEAGLPASMLQLEMRESVLWDPKFSKSLLTQMKESGLRLALDDFGSEMTTLPSLDKLPLDAVKPGQRLVNRLPSHQREAAILAAIVGVAHNLNITVCADGVETDDQFAAVKEQGCDSAQGYWLSSPLDASQMKQLIGAELTH
jgi:diguanylate cyclase (GGDEF)-like protein/PAS domain S-box-containing protein